MNNTSKPTLPDPPHFVFPKIAYNGGRGGCGLDFLGLCGILIFYVTWGPKTTFQNTPLFHPKIT
jgi:hypothetical protein